jgi:hypothetical protein
MGAALVVGVACGSSEKSGSSPAPAHGGAADGGAPPPYQSICEGRANLACSHEMAAGCDATEKAAGAAAAAAGCTKEWLATLTCREAHPDLCSGAALLQDEACRPAKDALDTCERGGGDPCTTPRDACTQCQCSTCPCDSACQAEQQTYFTCNQNCASATNFQACYDACNAATSAQFRTHVTCIANSCWTPCGGAAAGAGGTGN